MNNRIKETVNSEIVLAVDWTIYNHIDNSIITINVDNLQISNIVRAPITTGLNGICYE